MPPFIDIHCHLDWKELYEQVDTIVNNAISAEVSLILTNGTDKKTNRITLDLAKKYPQVKAALGVYPPEVSADEFDMDEFEQELDFIKDNKDEIVAVGEIGLDGKNVLDENLQRVVFRKQLLLAKEIDKPVIIHSRKAEKNVLDILEELEIKNVLMHCFGGKKSLAKIGIERKYFFSIPTSVLRSEQHQILADLVPTSQLFCETDAPFLSPDKEKRNEPANVVRSYEKVAQIKKLTLEELRNQVFMNWQRVFG